MLRIGRPLALRLSVLLPAMALLAGCGDEMKKSLGLGKNAPDEFQVVRRAPLALPPEFTLRPPQPGAVRPQEGSTSDQARNTLFGQSGNGQAAAAPAPDPAAPSASPRTPVSAMSVGGAVPPARPPVQAAAARPALVPEPPGPSRAEISLLKSAGADRSLPDIRTVIAEDLTKMATANERFIDTLLFWKKNEAPASVLDAQKENQRLQENAALGKSATAGETPTIKRKSRGILEGLF